MSGALHLCLLLSFAAALGPVAAPAAAGELKAWKGGPAPPLVLRDLQGKEHRLTDYKNHVVLLNFWATWCEPCREEMPSMQGLQDRLAGRPFAILAVDFGEGEAKVRQFLEKMPVRFPVLLDRDVAAAKSWRVRVLPTSLVIDPGQKIRYVVVGDLDWSAPHVEEAIRKLLPTP